MKRIPLIVALASTLIGGCYTQLPLVDEESPVVQETQPGPVWYPWPIIIVEPVFVAVPAPVATPHPTPAPSPRPIGVIRSESGSPDRSPVSPEVRTSGASRGGR